MSVDISTLLFFDASCLIAAAASSNGGSGFLWSLCERGLLTAAISQPVLSETEHNLRTKFPAQALARHHLQMAQGRARIAPVPRLDVLPRRYPEINPKDEHVEAAALAIGAGYLLTLDQPLAAEVNDSGLPIRAISPGEFIQIILPTHPSFVRLRDD